MAEPSTHQKHQQHQHPDGGNDGKNKNTKEKKNVVILGASYAGISVAHYLLKHCLPYLSSPSDYQIILVSPSQKTMCRPACPRAMISDDMFDQDKLFVDVEELFKEYQDGTQGKGKKRDGDVDEQDGGVFKFVHASAEGVELKERYVRVKLSPSESTSTTADSGSEQQQQLMTIPYHALVIATGASTPSPLMGLNTGDHKALREKWNIFRSVLPTARHIVIAGGGPTAVETAGELGEYLNGRPRWFSFLRSNPNPPKTKTKITLVTSGGEILPHLRPAIAHKAEKLLQRVGVEVVKNVTVTTVEEAMGKGNSKEEEEQEQGQGQDITPTPSTDDLLAKKVKVTLSTTVSLDADLYIPATGTIPNTQFLPPSLLLNSLVNTNPNTLRVSPSSSTTSTPPPPPNLHHIYAIGDCSNYARPAIHNILASIPVLCNNMKRDLLLSSHSQPNDADDDPSSTTATATAAVPTERQFVEDGREMQMVPIGTSSGVGAAMGFSLPGGLVWAVKGRDYWLWTVGGLWSGKQWLKES